MSKQLTNYTDVKKLENLDILEAIEFKSKSKEDILEVKIYSGRRLIRTYNKTKIIEGLLVIEPIILSACSIHRIEITTSPIIDESEIIFHQSKQTVQCTMMELLCLELLSLIMWQCII